MDNHTANARRKYHHVLTGGTLKDYDMGGIVEGIERKDAIIEDLKQQLAAERALTDRFYAEATKGKISHALGLAYRKARGM